MRTFLCAAVFAVAWPRLGPTSPTRQALAVQSAAARFVSDQQNGRGLTAVLDTFDAPIFSQNPTHAAAIAAALGVRMATSEEHLQCDSGRDSCKAGDVPAIRISNPGIVGGRLAHIDVQIFSNHRVRGSQSIVALPTTWRLIMLRRGAGWDLTEWTLSAY